MDKMLPILRPPRPFLRRSLALETRVVVLRPSHSSAVLGSVYPQCGDSSNSGQCHTVEKACVAAASALMWYEKFTSHATPCTLHTASRVWLVVGG